MSILKNKRVMLVNDDGIDAAGIALLEQAIQDCGAQLWVIAPQDDQSATSRHISLRKDIVAHYRDERRFAIAGTPSDCVLAALSGLMRHQWPDIVLSGVNAGSNLGEDIGYSGTVGAGFEALQNGIPAIAFSQVYTGEKNDMSFQCAAYHLPRIIEKLASYALEHCALLNVNFPPIAAQEVVGLRVAHQGCRVNSLDVEERKAAQASQDAHAPRHFYFSHTRSGSPKDKGSDLEAIARGYISVTPLTTQSTNYPQLTALISKLN